MMLDPQAHCLASGSFLPEKPGEPAAHAEASDASGENAARLHEGLRPLAVGATAATAPLAELVGPRRRLRLRHLSQWAAITAAGLIGCGWTASRISARFAAQAGFERVYAPADLQSLATTSDWLADQIIRPDNVHRALLAAPAAQAEYAGPNLSATLAGVVHVTRQELAPTSDRVVLEVVSRRPETAVQLAQALVATYVAAEQQLQPGPAWGGRLAKARAQRDNASAAVAGEKAVLERLQQEAVPGNPEASAATLEELQQARATVTAEVGRLRQVLAAPLPDLPVAPALALTDHAPNESLAQMALRRCIKERDELTATFTNQHPAVQNLNRKIRELSAYCQIQDVGAWVVEKDAAERDPELARREQATRQLAAATAELKALDAKEQALKEQQAAGEALQESLRAQQERLTAAEQLEKQQRVELARLEEMVERARGRPQVKFVPCSKAVEPVHPVGLRRRQWFVVSAACWSLLSVLLAYRSAQRKVPETPLLEPAE